VKGEVMGNRLVSVNSYSLAGDGITIEFSMKDPKTPELVYKDKQNQQKAFSGQSIRLAKLELGLMASVVLESIPDLQMTALSLAVPSANRINNQKSIPVKTFWVRSTTRTSIGGPEIVEGQIQSYEIHILEGNAW
jgi:hypothetical protein